LAVVDHFDLRRLSAFERVSFEFALGVEGLERFIRSEPLRRVHECVFRVLALESEPVDSRLSCDNGFAEYFSFRKRVHVARARSSS
jgi:PNKP adenylyltransferase domain, C-terminal region